MIKSITKKIYYSALDLLLFDKIKLSRIKKENKLLVINLHRVSFEKNPFWSPLQPETFEDLLKFLRENFEVCLFGEIKEKSEAEKPLAIISFDDGYYDFIEYALPLLEKYKIRANMNIIPQCVEENKPMWNIRLYDFLNSAPISLINEIKLPDFNAKIEKDSYAEKLKFGLEISRYLKMRPKHEREELFNLIEPLFDKVNFKFTKMMSKSDILQISDKTEIGVHSYAHESMKFEEFTYFVEDFAKCKNYFSEKLKLPLEIYAFPNGSFREEQIDFLRKENIKHILLVDEKMSEIETDVYTRITTFGDSQNEIKFRALGY